MRYGHFELFIYTPSRKRACTGSSLARFWSVFDRDLAAPDRTRRRRVSGTLASSLPGPRVIDTPTALNTINACRSRAHDQPSGSTADVVRDKSSVTEWAGFIGPLPSRA